MTTEDTSGLSPRRAAAYIRVSSEEQTEGWSLEGQEQTIREYAERQGFEIAKLYTDDTTGAEDDRPGLESMMLDARARQFQAIIIVHTSRLFRNVALARMYKARLRNKLDIDMVFLNQPAMDPNDPNAFLTEGINELFDEYYLHQLRFWTTLGKKTRAQQGMWNGTLPFGYMTDEETGEPVLHPENAKGLLMAFKAYATGRYTDGQVAELLNREGYRTTGNWGERPFTKDTVNRILRNVFYRGLVKYKGELFPGKHPPLVDQELFDQAQEARARRRAKRRSFGHKKSVYLLAGIVRCEDCQLTLRCSKTGSKGQWRYYRHLAKQRGYDCPEPGSYLRADDLEAKWGEIIARFKLPEDWRKRVQELIGNADEREKVQRERTRTEEKLRRLKQMYRDLIIDEEEYRSALKDLQMQLASLVLPSSPHLIEAGEYLEHLGKLWEQATMQERRDITVLLLKSLYVNISAQEIVAIEPNSVFRLLFTEVCEDLGIEIR